MGLQSRRKSCKRNFGRRYGAIAFKELIQQKLLEREARERGIKVMDNEVVQL
jgi:hypothetical protein